MGSIPYDISSRSRSTKIPARRDIIVPSSVVGQGHDLDRIIEKLGINSDIKTLLQSVGPSFTARQITVATTPTQIIAPSKSNIGYILCTPEIVDTTTLLSSGLTSGTDVNAGSFDYSSAEKISLFLNISASSLGALVVNLQAQDPITFNWVTTQGDIFGGSVANGDYYATFSSTGLEKVTRFNFVPSGGGTATVTMAGQVKVKPRIWIGNSNVTVDTGFCLPPNIMVPWYLYENTSLYAVAQGSPSGIVGVLSLQ